MKEWVNKKIDRSYTYTAETERQTETERNRIHKSCKLPSLTFLFADVMCSSNNAKANNSLVKSKRCGG